MEVSVKLARFFRLSETAGSGVHCSEHGLFVGQTPLLEQTPMASGRQEWRPRQTFQIQCDLGKMYGISVDTHAICSRLAFVACALNDNDTSRAQVSALLLQLPDPPSAPVTKSNLAEFLELAKQLQASGLLSRDWNPDKHPRQPAGSPDGTGGEFAPLDGAQPPQSPSNLGGPNQLAWDEKMQACHEQCVHLTLQRDGITYYRRCMRECLGGASADY
jgi:hypothetical protein